MRRLIVLLAGLVVAAPMMGAVQRPLIFTSQDHSLVTLDDCEHFYTHTVASLPAQAQSEEDLPVPLAGIDVLRVRASEGGGVSIKGWDRPVARLTVCKYAVALTQLDAQKTLSDVLVTSHNGEIAAHGPQNDDTKVWWVHMILRVPKRAALDVASANGGIAIRNMTGRVTARATNGGISLASCAGDSRVTTDGGGISLEKITGKLEANSHNGSISLRLPTSDPPSVEARTDDTGEIFCRAKVCADALSSREGHDRVVRIGGMARSPMIRLFSGSAPILIDQVR